MTFCYLVKYLTRKPDFIAEQLMMREKGSSFLGVSRFILSDQLLELPEIQSVVHNLDGFIALDGLPRLLNRREYQMHRKLVEATGHKIKSMIIARFVNPESSESGPNPSPVEQHNVDPEIQGLPLGDHKTVAPQIPIDHQVDEEIGRFLDSLVY